MIGWSRAIQVEISSLEEWRGGDGPVAATLFGDGSDRNLRIGFSVSKHMISTGSPSTVDVYNLSPGLRAALQKSEAKITLRAGWSTTGLVHVFSGSLLNVVHQRRGADIVTTLISLAGWGAQNRSPISQTHNGGSKLKDVVISIASEMPGLTIEQQLVRIKEGALGPQGWSFLGPAPEALDRLARVYGFSWWVADGIFHALDDDKTFDETATIKISPESGLLRAEPMLASPFQVQTGVTIQSLFNPYIQPGRSVILESKVNPNINRSYRVHTLHHEGDTHSSQWTTNIESWIVV